MYLICTGGGGGGSGGGGGNSGGVLLVVFVQLIKYLLWNSGKPLNVIVEFLKIAYFLILKVN